jgi:hypothetical protein
MRNGPASRRSEPDEDLVRLYLQDISRYPLLTRDDEVRLARRIETGMAALRTGGGEASGPGPPLPA